MAKDNVPGKAARLIEENMKALKAFAQPITIPPITLPGITLPKNVNPAEWTYERLAKYIEEFEKSLDNEHEIGARLVSFGQSIVFHIDDIGYHGPDIITFYGKDNIGQDVQLIQNIAQLSVLLVAMKKLGEKAKRIGFQLVQEIEKDKQGELPDP